MFSLITSASFAQADSSKASLTFSGYAEVYYSYDFGNPGNHERPSFFYNFNRHNEANLNLGFINAGYAAKNVRANFGLMEGTWAQYNSSAEQPLLKNLWQANIGVKLSKNKNFWLDAGVFPSHIGFESPVGKTCDALTRCIIGDNTPSWESGIKIGYTSDNGKWFFSDTKRSRSRRPITLQSWIVALLRDLQTKTSAQDLDPEARDLVFRTESGQPINADYLAKHFRSVLDLAGLPRMRLYDLRHSAATIALAAGVSPKVVSEQLGHASTAFTLDTYAHVLPHMQDEAAARVEAMLFRQTA